MSEPLTLRGDRCRCSLLTEGCGESFNSTAAFDKHRVWAEGKVIRRCLTVEEMLAKGMAKNASGYWVTALMPLAALPGREEHAI